LGRSAPGCTIVTSGGRHGAKVGYSDEPLSDGSWWYFGLGCGGDYLLENPANRRLAEGLHTVLLVTTREPTAAEVRHRRNYQKVFRFKGMFNSCGHEAVSLRREPRRAISCCGSCSCLSAEPWLLACQMALAVHSSDYTGPTYCGSPVGCRRKPATIANYRQRSFLVMRYALLRAAGKCEECGSLPLFVDDAGNGFLEVHHIHRLAHEGDDAPENVAGVCLNCHR